MAGGAFGHDEDPVHLGHGSCLSCQFSGSRPMQELPMPMWRVQLLGGFAISREGADLAGNLGRREKALIAYLALAPEQSATRDHLAEIIFEHTTGTPALREAARRIRSVLDDPGILLKDSNPLKLGVAPSSVDAITFEELACSDSEDALAQATETYRGPLLLGIDARSEAFEDWLRDRRTYFQTISYACHHRLAQMRFERGDHERALAAVRRLGEIDDGDERGYVLEMRILARMGRASDIRRTWDRLLGVLGKDHGLRPCADVQAIYESAIATATSYVDGGGSTQSASSATPDQERHAALSEAPWTARILARTRSSWLRRRMVPVAVASGVALAGTAATVLVGTAVIFWRVPELAPAPLGTSIRDVKTYLQGSSAPSIIVLPFASSGDSDAPNFAEALSEGLESTLSVASDIAVISGYSTETSATLGIPLRVLAGDLGARYVLDGHLLKHGTSFSVSTRLVDTYLKEKVIWGHTYMRDTEDFVSLQRDVMLDVAVSLEVQLTEGEQARISYGRGTINLDAWIASSQAVKHVRLFTSTDNARARLLYAQAADIDPNYAGAWEGIAWTHFIDARFGWSTSREESLHLAADLAQRALSIDPKRGRTYSLLGSLALVQSDYDQAIALGEKAVALEPNDADSLALLAYTLTYTGEAGRALALVDRAIKLRPAPPRWYVWLKARALRMAGEVDESARMLEKAVQADFSALVPLVELAESYVERGDVSRARRIANQIRDLHDQFSVSAWMEIPRHRDTSDQERETQILTLAGLPM